MASSLNERQLEVVNCIEQIFWETGNVPSYELVSKRVGLDASFVRSTVEKSQTARAALAARGVDLNVDKSAQLLTSEQLMAANLVMNSHDTRSLREKLELIGVSSQKWHAWLRQPGFSNYLTKRAEESFGANDWAAYGALAENIADGDLNAVKFHFEMRGKYKQSVDVNINIEQVVVNIVEIIARHVQDEGVILAIANEIERALPGAEGVKNAAETKALTQVSGL